MGYRLRNVGATKIWLWIAPQLPYPLGKDLIRLIADYLFDFYQFPFDGRLRHLSGTRWQCETFMTFLQSPKQEIIIPSPGKRTGKTTALFGIVATLLLQRNHISIVTLHVSLRQARFFMERIWSQIKVHLKAFQRNSEYLELVGSRNTLACIPATMRNFRYVGPTYLFVDDGSIQNLKSQFIEECKALGSKVFIVG